MTKFLFSQIIAAMLVLGCSDSKDSEENESDNNNDTGNDTEGDIPAGMGRIEGVVTDGDGVALSNVKVQTAEGSVTTDFAGRFQMDLEPGEAVIGFVRSGYAESALSVSITEGAATPIQEGMLKRREAMTVNVDEGGLVGDEARVSLSSGSLVAEDGTVAAGDIKVSITPMDVTGDLTAAPGDFSALKEGGDETQLETLAMAEYHFEDLDGNMLQVADGKKVQVEMDVPAEIAAEVGEEIPAWYFDSEAGKWVEEGVGKVIESDDGTLVWQVEVSHFSWWNADKPIDERDCVSGIITDCNGNPVRGASLRAQGVDYNGESSAYPDNDGSYCVDIKRGAQADLLAVGKVGNNTVGRRVTVTGADAGASCENGEGCTELDIELPCDPAESDLDCSDSPLLPCSACLSGRVLNPDGDAVDNASITLEDLNNGFKASAISDADGTFCVTAPLNSEVELKINAIGFPPYTVTAIAEKEGQCPDCQDLGDLTLEERSDGDTVYESCNISNIQIEAANLDGASEDMESFPYVGMILFSEDESGASGYIWLSNASDPDNMDGASGIFLFITIPADGAAGDSVAMSNGLGIHNAGGVVGVNSDLYNLGDSAFTWNEDITGGAQTLTGSMEFELVTNCGTALHTIQYAGTFSTEILTLDTYIAMTECSDLASTFPGLDIESIGAVTLDTGSTVNFGTNVTAAYFPSAEMLSISAFNDASDFSLIQNTPVFGSQDISSITLADSTCSYEGTGIPEIVIETNDAQNLSSAFSGTFTAEIPSTTTDCTEPVAVSGTFTAAVCSE